MPPHSDAGHSDGGGAEEQAESGAEGAAGQDQQDEDRLHAADAGARHPHRGAMAARTPSSATVCAERTEPSSDTTTATAASGAMASAA